MSDDCIMLYIDSNLINVYEIITFVSKLKGRIVLCLIYSYEKERKLTQEMILKINDDKAFIHSYLNLECIHHLGRKNCIFIMKKNILDDIVEYTPNYIYILSEYNEFISKYLIKNNCRIDASFLYTLNLIR